MWLFGNVKLSKLPAAVWAPWTPDLSSGRLITTTSIYSLDATAEPILREMSICHSRRRHGKGKSQGPEAPTDNPRKKKKKKRESAAAAASAAAVASSAAIEYGWHT